MYSFGLLLRRENVSDWLADELTILGAWDYAVADPDGLLGGGATPWLPKLDGDGWSSISVGSNATMAVATRNTLI